MTDADKVTIECPHCRRRIKAKPAHLGREVACPASECGRRFTAGALDELSGATNPFLDPMNATATTPEVVQRQGTASNPGRVQVRIGPFLRYYCTWTPATSAAPLLGVVLLLGGIVFAIVTSSWSIELMSYGVGAAALGLVITMAMASQLRDSFRQVEAQFKHGCANPGVVVALDPVLIAVYTDLTFGEGEYPVIKITPMPLPEPPGKRLKIGDFVPTIAVYGQPTMAGMNHWSNFYPIAVALAADAAAVAQVNSTFSETDLRELTEALQHVPQPYEPGLYLLWPEPGKELGRMADFPTR